MPLTWSWRRPHILGFYFFLAPPAPALARSFPMLINPSPFFKTSSPFATTLRIHPSNPARAPLLAARTLRASEASMEGAPKAGGSGKAVPPVPAAIGAGAGAGAAKSSARAARKARSLPAKAAAAGDAPAVATAAAAAESWGGEEDDDDEQVERFYALLANIRALRGAYGPVDGGAEADGGDAGGGGATNKRLRGSEPPWRPAFRLEDFEEPSPAPDVVAKRTRRQHAEADGAGVRVRRLGSGGERV